MMTPGFEDRTDRWMWIEQLARQLAADRELADSFERTPGKVLRQLGFPPEAIGPVLAALSRSPLPESDFRARPDTPPGEAE